MEEEREGLKERVLITLFSFKKGRGGNLIAKGGFVYDLRYCTKFEQFRAGTSFFLNFCLMLEMPSLKSEGLYCYCDEINLTGRAKSVAALLYSSKPLTLFSGFFLDQFLRENPLGMRL